MPTGLRHFLSLRDVSSDELLGLLEAALVLKRGERVRLLEGKVLGMIFRKHSTRTRVSFETGMFHQGYIEPQNAAAFWNQDGQITIWTSTQGAFSVRDQVAAVLKVPTSSLILHPSSEVPSKREIQPSESGSGASALVWAVDGPAQAKTPRKKESTRYRMVVVGFCVRR